MYGFEIRSPSTSMRPPPAERQRQQQRGQELRGHVAADPHRSSRRHRDPDESAAADSRRWLRSRFARRCCAARRRDRRSVARACAARRAARYSPPDSASAAVSGRNAVPALPRNRSACLTGKHAALHPADLRLPSNRTTPRRVSACDHHPRVIRIQQSGQLGRPARQRREQQRPGSKCSWSRAGARCRGACRAAAGPETSSRQCHTDSSRGGVAIDDVQVIEDGPRRLPQPERVDQPARFAAGQALGDQRGALRGVLGR